MASDNVADRFRLRGLDGGIITTPRVAREVAALVRCAMDEATKRDRVPFHPDTWAWLYGIEAAAAEWHGGRNQVVATTNDGRAATTTPTLLSVSEAADRAGITRQGMLSRIARGEIPGSVRDDRGRWHVPADAVQPKARGT